ncbi:hypothetical protein BG011_009786 [Mortierella polycephala]|uniref:NAD(P)-binding protein n=1 Tax=Mortierella polycephala TaxID=41804 RepID=A0A9P6Q852_9FUNG|nr:hypothetical protein BG011_009786 [Mortierella polycephala]
MPPMLESLYDINYWKTFVQKGNFSMDQIPDLSSKVAIVTGANNGLGYETTLALASHGAHVFLACRNKAKALDAIERLERELAETAPHLYPKLDFLYLDLSDLRSVARSANEFLAKGLSLHILINNAGLGLSPPGLSKDGIEQVFAVNHMGSVSHEMQLPLGGIQFGTLGQADAESPFVNYNRSKLANILYAKALARRLTKEGHSRVFVNAAHPGYCLTGIDDGVNGTLGYVISKAMSTARTWVGRTAADGALTQLYCSTSPEIEEKQLTGRYFVPDAHELRPISYHQPTAIYNMFGFDKSHEQVYGETTHKSSWSHELIAGAAAFEAMKHAEGSGGGHHKLSKEVFAGFAAAEADKLIETKGLDFVDREEVQRNARRNAEQIYDAKYA